ncbi:MAG: hypothetical protein KKH99_00420, partial [Proteobacteria bacterium]|nr:hypothetical protein [Pseudomonadota bacterium]
MNSISELKKIIHPLNGAVSDFDIKLFDAVILNIWQSYKHLPPVIPLLKMIRSLVLYLFSKKNAAHMDTVPILNDLIHQLEHIITVPSLGREKMDEILSSRLEEYKIFQNKIVSNPDMDIQDMDELKSVILAIDWEISDKTLHHFDTVVSQLLNKLKPYKIHHTFLKMIHSIGRFIGIQKANAPTDSISFLRSLFDHLQEIIQKKELSFDEKKKILEKDISRFNDFKIRISKSGKKSREQSGNEHKNFIPDNDGILPALSHLKSSKARINQDPMSLTCLPEEDSSLLNEDIDSENIKPALSNMRGVSKTPRDVMDDLFTIKESPADELLDAIHLMEIQGNADPSGSAMQIFDKEDAIESDGVKKFITQKKDNAPIAEINSRLDEFFNLETPADAYPEPLGNNLPETSADGITDKMVDSMDMD